MKKHKEIEKPINARQLVIPDIHGCYHTFMALLKKVDLKKEDHLFLLGDYIDRGTNSNAVLNHIIELMETGYNIFPLRGNHEEMVLKKHNTVYDKDSLNISGTKWGKDIMNKEKKIFPVYEKFIKNLPYYYITENYLIVHAGINFDAEKPFEDYYSMLWCNEITNIPKDFTKTIIHGHVVIRLKEIQKSIAEKHQVIGLDNGCVYGKRADCGDLLCFNLDTYELIMQENIE